ncbi:MAG: MotA/TolQ/ExbB proton channel family protein [Planctomycetes bacterium]|jgi:biopolymer transport protein ExbB|nr:MotA/TolQ/ExbB proton channel family protein [Planctomycetota bacterium]
MLLTVPLHAADSAKPDLAKATAAAREAAEAQLATARTRIAGEHTALLKDLQTALAAANSARDRLVAAEREATVASDDLAKRTREQERESTLIRQLADRAMVSARLGETQDRALQGRPPLERVAAALAGIAARTAALPTRLALRVGEEPIITRNGRQLSVPVVRLGEARAIAIGSDDNARGVLERAADGSSWLVIGPSLPAVIAADAKSPALIALDAAGSAAHQPGEVHRTLAEWLAAGRFFIWPIIAVFLIGILIALERVISLFRRAVDPRRLLEVAGHLARDDAAGANALVAGGTSPLDRVLSAGLAALGRPREAREAAVEQALLAETGQLTRGLPAIAVLAGVAPLLGLLGTVTGMIDMFAVIAAQGSGNAKSLSGGISEALVCTQAGMLAAIPLLLLHAWLARLADRRSQLLEEAACGVLGLTEHGDQVSNRREPPEVLA